MVKSANHSPAFISIDSEKVALVDTSDDSDIGNVDSWELYNCIGNERLCRGRFMVGWPVRKLSGFIIVISSFV